MNTRKLHSRVTPYRSKNLNAEYNPARGLIAAADKLADEVMGYGFVPQAGQSFALAG